MIRLVIALVLIFVFSSIAIGMLRSFQTRPGAKVLDEPQFIDAGSRIVFRCEECGTEVLLLVRGSEAPPRHCGERMHEREEISRS